MKNTFGSDLSLTIFGESHGRAVGAVLDGMAAGVPVDESFLAACMDKRRARRRQWRVPEKLLFLAALLGGSAGAWAGMYVFRHKTRHWYFVIGMPVILLVQLLLIRFFG